MISAGGDNLHAVLSGVEGGDMRGLPRSTLWRTTHHLLPRGGRLEP